ncbi:MULTISPECIES: hypothetical protein [unclassified Klebsiella]|uniref:hypothetical protein n=1 Tax=unclassified Klebsiella TaxID=2608929 RepID=UPI0013FDE139|nr:MULTISPECIES: hypothetical protein [unclassified Klebsiella]
MGRAWADVVTAWNYQQDRIHALVEALEKAQYLMPIDDDFSNEDEHEKEREHA